MNPFDDRSETISFATIDRLVDGDLPEGERREVLLRLDTDPEGWRRLALAFLEDQAWRSALMASVSERSSPRALPGLALPSTIRNKKAWPLRLSIAATVLACTFLAGYSAGGFRKVSPRPEIAKGDTPASVAEPETPRTGEIREVGSFQLVDGSDGETPPARFPILSGPGLDDRWLHDQPPSVPDYLRARWERQGFQVAEHRKVMSVELEDGRQVSIPVDEVEVAYVGQQPL